MPQATMAEIVQAIHDTGGATVPIHGRRYLMGDALDGPLFVVGGAADFTTGEQVETVRIPLDALTPTTVQVALELMAHHAGRNVFAAAGFWLHEGEVHIDLVETTTLYHVAMQWAEEREQEFIFDLRNHQSIATPWRLKRVMDDAQANAGRLS